LRGRLKAIGGTVAVVFVAFAVYHFAISSSSVAGHLVESPATSVIGSGEDAIGVTASGAILSGGPTPGDGSLPRLPIDEPPKNGRLAGPLLEQALVLGAAPPILRSCIEGSRYGESGVDVELNAGIELRFGSASRAEQKWAAATAILADPTTTDIGYVDLHSPFHASTGGSGGSLPPPEPGSATTCGS
jgi:hypothetical protein